MKQKIRTTIKEAVALIIVGTIITAMCVWAADSGLRKVEAYQGVGIERSIEE